MRSPEVGSDLSMKQSALSATPAVSCVSSDTRAGGAGGAAAHGAEGQRAAAAGPAAGGAEAAASQEEEQAGSSRRTGEKRVAWMFFLFPLRCFMPGEHTHTRTHAHCLRVHDCDIIISLLPVIVVRQAIVLILRFQSLSAPLF